MKRLSEAPPVAYMDTTEVLAFVTCWIAVCIFSVYSLLWLPGFDSVFLFCLEVWFAYYYWPVLIKRARQWLDMQKFKKSIPDSIDMEEK